MARSKRKRRGSGTVPIVLGILVLLLPVVLTLVNDYQLRQASQRYAEQVRRIEPDSRVRQLLEEAHAYNRRLAASGHHAMPPSEESPGFAEYMKTLSPPETHGTIARLTIPAIGVDLPVFHTTHPSVLYQGVGHMFGSDLPVGGEGTTAVLSAHTGMVNASMFDNLPRLRDGDDVYVHVLGQTLRYQVRHRRVVKPDDTTAVTYEPGQDKLVLITCTPYGINTDRLLVETVRVPLEGGQDDAGWLPQMSWWMWLDLLLITLVLLWLWRRRRREREQRRLRCGERK